MVVNPTTAADRNRGILLYHADGLSDSAVDGTDGLVVGQVGRHSGHCSLRLCVVYGRLGRDE